MSTQLTDTERERIKIQADRDSVYLDNIGRAKKIAHGIEENDDLSTNRALWELVQNANDLCPGECSIIVNYANDRIEFCHNGNQFTPKTLNSLIKQISSKSDKDEEQVGQYGTGFLTTHTFGTKFQIKGSLEIAEDCFVEIVGPKDGTPFLIDRSENDPEKLIELLDVQLTNAKNLLDRTIVEKEPYTSFAYLFDSDVEKENGAIAIEEFKKLAPYVMVFNPNITNIKIINSIVSETITYEYKEKVFLEEYSVFKTSISVNKKELINFYSIVNDNKSIEIILPLESEDRAYDVDRLNSTPKLFLYYPLIQTENFGTNFIINSTNFYPKDKRNGIRLKSNNPQRAEKEEHNRNLVNEASAMTLEYLKEHAKDISNGIGMSRISFTDSGAGEYEEQMQKTWIDTFLELPLCDLGGDNNKPEKVKETVFLEDELRDVDTAFFDAIYYFASIYHPKLVKKNQIKRWSEIVEAWGTEHINFISCLDIVTSISEEYKNKNFIENEHLTNLHQFHEFIISIEKHSCFEEYYLIPNRKGKLFRKGNLLRPEKIDTLLYEFMLEYLPDTAERFISSNYLDLFSDSLLEYNRKNLQDDITSIVDSYNKKREKNEVLSEEEYSLLIEFCSFYPALDESKSTQRQLMPLICEYYKVDYNEIHLPNINEQEIDYRTAFRCLIRAFILDMSLQDSEWINTNREFVKDVLKKMKNFRDFTDTLKLSGIYVNQNNEFCLPTELKVEKDIPGDLKSIYFDIMQKDVKNILVAEDFQPFWDFREEDKLQGGTLANELESKFFEHDVSKINGHPYRTTILNIIDKITENCDSGLWASLFKNIENSKEVIMMATITDGERKNSMFKILTANDDTLNAIASLTTVEDIDRILALGKQALEKEIEDAEDWDFKTNIGTHLEILIKKELSDNFASEDIPIECIPEQGGQDIIVKYKDEPIYYIEIKGRWIPRESVLMSSAQIKRAKMNPNCYSICCINLSDYVDENDSKKRFYPPIDVVKERLRALPNIGSKVDALLQNEVDVTPTTVILGGDYKAVVPQALFDLEGITFNKFVEDIVGKIK